MDTEQKEKQGSFYPIVDNVRLEIVLPGAIDEVVLILSHLDRWVDLLATFWLVPGIVEVD